MLPSNVEVVDALHYVKNEFGGVDTALIVIEVDPSISNSSEIRYVYSPAIVGYMDRMAQKAVKLREIRDASSIADFVKEGEYIPQSEREILSKLNSNPLSRAYVSEDYSMALVRLKLIDKFDESKVYRKLLKIVEESPPPSGIKVSVSGHLAIVSSLRDMIGPDMGKTSTYSLLGILIIVILLFRSLSYGLISLMAIVFGTLWSFGLMGILGMKISSQTAGAASMIMGIGIDFGIQIVSRFRIELKRWNSNLSRSLSETLRGVALPISTTTASALIGFQAMTMGKLTILSDLAKMMSLGIVCCMFAALTVIPSFLILGERYIRRIKGGE